jgi:hypothetical protein
LPASTGILLSTTSPKAGNVIQVVQANTTNTVSTSSTSFTSTGFSVTITPQFSNSKILVSFCGQAANNSATQHTFVAIYRNSTQITNTIGVMGDPSYWYSVGGIYLDSPSTTSATTYTVYFAATAGTASFNWGSSALSSTSTLIAQEIAA